MLADYNKEIADFNADSQTYLDDQSKFEGLKTDAGAPDLKAVTAAEFQKLQSELDKINSDAKQMAQRISDLNAKVNALRAQIEALIAKLKALKFSCGVTCPGLAAIIAALTALLNQVAPFTIAVPNPPTLPAPPAQVSTTDTPPPPTQVTPPNVQVSCCGPDITVNVLGAMLNLIKQFLADSDKQEETLDSLTKLIGWNKGIELLPSEHAWDILELTPVALGGSLETTMGLFKGKQNCMKPIDPCDPSVEFLKNCHNPQVVNYVMWGVLARLYDWYYYESKGNPVEEGAKTVRQRQQYSDSDLSIAHGIRGGTPLHKSPEYQDQVAMASVGWQLADLCLRRIKRGTSPYQLTALDTVTLQATLEEKQNQSRKTALCMPGACGKFPTDRPFNYFLGPE